MNRPLTVFLPIPGDTRGLSAALGGDPAGWLPPPAEPAGPDEWTVMLHAGPARHQVVCHVGAAWTSDGVLWRPLFWQPQGTEALGRLVDKVLPDFDGEIGLLDSSGSTLVLTGSYEPPGGALGTAGDLAGGRYVADTSGRRFLEDVARQLRRLLPTGADRE